MGDTLGEMMRENAAINQPRMREYAATLGKELGFCFTAATWAHRKCVPLDGAVGFKAKIGIGEKLMYDESQVRPMNETELAKATAEKLAEPKKKRLYE